VVPNALGCEQADHALHQRVAIGVGEYLTTIDGFVLKASFARTIAAAFAEIVRAQTGMRLDR